MRVDDLLHLESIGLHLVWGDPGLLRREVTGVTATDLRDPTAYLQSGEVVLSGLVWWTPRGGRNKADQFVAALRNAGAVALLAGVVRHNGVPAEIVRACREQQIALVAVPAHTTFRTITDAIYVRRWSDLSSPTDLALPDNVPQSLHRLVRDEVAPDVLLDRISTYLGGLPCALVTASGRTIARCSGASESAPAAIADSLRRADSVNQQIKSADAPYDAWYLHLPVGREAPPLMLREVAEVLRHYRELSMQAHAAGQLAVEDLLAELDDAMSERASLALAMRACGMAEQGRYRVISAATVPYRRVDSVAALRELVSHITDRPFVVGSHGAQAVAIIGDISNPVELVRSVHDLVQSCDPGTSIHVGVGSAAGTAEELRDSFVRSNHAQRAAASLGRDVAAAEDLTTLNELLAGVSAPVRAAYSTQVLGALLEPGASHAGLRATLAAFLDHNGSWTKTAEALYLHVNTVHYRIERIEKLTGRDLSSLADRVDVRAALLSAAATEPDDSIRHAS
ncbi:PucR family transcriptional regulator [Nocardia sp. NPDC057440]|uniref:PucR family transcriptional regulator n=1 Tax=Nocardia sp. NPDC057440 TaxID=3346134 RepID=UPI0036702B07